MLPPELQSVAQKRYAELLAQITDRSQSQLQALFEFVARGALDWAEAEEIAVHVLAGAESASVDLAGAHMGILLGEPVPVDTTAETASEDVAAEIVTAMKADPVAGAPTADAAVSNLVFTAASSEAQRVNAALGKPITQWRRVLSAGEVCGLCVLVADRLYKRGDLKPVHDNCRCTVQPVIGPRPTGHDPLVAEVRAQMKATARRLGKPKTRNKTHSRASNVRVENDSVPPTQN